MAGRRELGGAYTAGPGWISLTPPVVIEENRAGLGVAIKLHRSPAPTGALLNAAGSMVSSAKLNIVQLWMKFTKSVRKFGSSKTICRVRLISVLPNMTPCR